MAVGSGKSAAPAFRASAGRCATVYVYSRARKLPFEAFATTLTSAVGKVEDDVVDRYEYL